ncbi:MAG: hypothetical protein BWK78_06575 [Thiotrichaceae bacterium IS1]|nr:MAG: hypothetical protein BWK78_06575 [Thiotrichaceae bacterium IS1]
MKWIKKGLIYVADGSVGTWATSHAMVPTPEQLSEDVIRVYLTFCDQQGIGRVGYVDVNAENPKEILNVSKQPILDIGEPGTFDENGVLQTSIISLPNGKKRLYYVGFELGTKIRYRLLSGLAMSDDGETFQRIQKTPILERSHDELYFRCAPFVKYEDGIFKLWYVAGSHWTLLDGKEMPVYTINYLESLDGIHWGNKGRVCIDIANDEEHGFGRPFVLKKENLYQMFYSIRVKHLGYRLGYAESSDGIHWTRKDHEIGIDVSASGWDSQMICYSAVMSVKDKVYMFYNGNEFGKTGFGYAELER